MRSRFLGCLTLAATAVVTFALVYVFTALLAVGLEAIIP